MGSNIASLASPADNLASLIHKGPGGVWGGGVSPFQQAIDSFAIGQSFLKQGDSASAAVPWLQQGAAQPQGFGVMSQLSLANLYAGGANGVVADPQRAQYYLQEALRSMATLSGSNTKQSQQLLKNLPGSPEKIKSDIEKAILQLQGKGI